MYCGNDEQEQKFDLNYLRDELIKLVTNNKMPIFYWCIANLVLSLFFPLWYKFIFESPHIFSDIVNSAYIIFINALLFSFLPNLNTKSNKGYNMLCFF